MMLRPFRRLSALPGSVVLRRCFASLPPAGSSPASPAAIRLNVPPSARQQKALPSFSPSLSRRSLTMSNTLGMIVFLGLAAFTACLGGWQLQRKHWKEGLIASRKAALQAPPIPLLSLIGEHGNDSEAIPEFQRVSLTGRPLYEREVRVGLRAAPAGSSAAASGLAGQGHYVYTPLQLQTGDVVLLNRGWTPRLSSGGSSAAPHERSGRDGLISIEGVTRRGEKAPRFLPQSSGLTSASAVRLFLDLPAVASELRLPTATSAVVDAVSPSPEPARLLRRQLDSFVAFPTSPLIHTAYAVTWFGLSVCLVIGTWMRFRSAARPADRTAAMLQRNLQTMKDR